jgi:hypothetical protein
MAFDDLARRMGAPPIDGKDPHALIAEGERAAAQQARTRNLILGVIMLVAAAAFGVFGVLIYSGHALETAELSFGCFGLAISLLFVGMIKVARGVR